MNTNLRKQAIDPGFGGFKAAWLDDSDEIQTLTIPSQVGIGQINDLGLLGLGRQRRQARPLDVRWANGHGAVAYLVGDNVQRHAEPITDLDFQRLAEGMVNRALMYAALGSTVNGRPMELALMIGLPVEVLKDRERAKATLKAARGWLLGPHNFTVDERPVQIEVTQIKAAAQPVGAYFDWGLNAAGEWVRDTEALKRPVAVCDIGFNTLDLFAVEGGQITDRFTAGDTLGMHRVARAVAAHLARHYQVKIGLQQADALLRDYLRRGRVEFACAAGEVDLSGVVAQALEQTFTDINAFLTEHWGSGRQFYQTIFTGGGAEALREPLLRRYPATYLPADLVTSNARGLLKWAQRPGVFRG